MSPLLPQPLIQCHDFNELFTIMAVALEEYTASEILLVLDLDLTLIKPANHCASTSSKLAYAQSYQQIKALPCRQLERAMTIVGRLPQVLTHANVPLFLDTMAQLSIKTIGLTTSITGGWMQNEQMNLVKIQTLRNLDIRFSDPYPENEFTLSNEHGLAGMCQGVLFTNGKQYSKGYLLTQWLQAMNLQPRMLIFIDDLVANLDSVITLSKSSLPACKVVGVHYEELSEPCGHDEFIKFWEEIKKQAS